MMEHERVFKTTKEMLKDAPVLTHYDPSKVLSCGGLPTVL